MTFFYQKFFFKKVFLLRTLLSNILTNQIFQHKKLKEYLVYEGTILFSIVFGYAEFLFFPFGVKQVLVFQVSNLYDK